MAKNGLYKTVYFSDGVLLGKIEKWRSKNKTPTFNAALIRLVSLGLGAKANSPDRRVRSVVRDELKKYFERVQIEENANQNRTTGFRQAQPQ